MKGSYFVTQFIVLLAAIPSSAIELVWMFVYSHQTSSLGSVEIVTLVAISVSYSPSRLVILLNFRGAVTAPCKDRLHQLQLPSPRPG